MLSPAEILKLARLYGAAEGVALSTVGRRAANNNKLFRRISEGFGVSTRTLAKLETFFRANWPDNAPWPPDVLPPLRKRRTRQHTDGALSDEDSDANDQEAISA